MWSAVVHLQPLGVRGRRAFSDVKSWYRLICGLAGREIILFEPPLPTEGVQGSWPGGRLGLLVF